MCKSALFKCALIVLAPCFVTSSQAQTFTSLRSFQGTNGANPWAALIQGANGNYYGITSSGGIGYNPSSSDYGAGIVFEMSPNGKITVIYSFCSQMNSLGICLDGASPTSLVLGGNGNFYGTTYSGGVNDYGTVFELTTAGKLTTIYNFCAAANCMDGEEPYGLIQGTNGNYFGVTYRGGAHGGGVVFEVSSAGKLTLVHTFAGSDGANPFAPLLQASNGNFYGIAFSGGTGKGSACSGCGTLFEITPTGQFTTLYDFCTLSNCLDGSLPQGSLIQATDGNLYGTTAEGGTNDSGTIFKMNPAGQFNTLYNFCSVRNSKFQCVDGYMPLAALVQGNDGNFYGTTALGGERGYGNIFQFTPQGTLTSLYNYCLKGSCPDGMEPGFLMQATNGMFYGNTQIGGDINACPSDPSGPGCGTIASLNVGLGPFIEATPNFGKVGNTTHILGNNLTGTTSVTFNGVPASFTVVNNTYIKATVPSGATAGTIQVVTPYRTLSSSAAFNVLP